MAYIDLHCDTLLLKNFPDRPDTLAENSWSVDFRRMRTGGCAAQFFAVFLPTPNYFRKNGLPRPDDWDYVRARIADLQEELQAHTDSIAFAGSAEELLRNRQSGRMSAFLTIEDGRLLEGNLENIPLLHSMGIRLISLTWNDPNCLGYPHSAQPEEMAKGLTPFGKEAVLEMQRNGIVVDVSHLSDGGFWDVLRLSERPVVASHSNARAVCGHTRNLTDDMIRALAEKGGASGLNFAPEMLSQTAGRSCIQDMIAHLQHFIQVGGEDFPMIGTDFDGIHGDLEIPSCGEMPLLFQAMKKAGMTERQIEKIAFGNALRIIQEGM